LGAIFGFQSWRLAEYGFAIPIPWCGLTWILLGHMLLGLSVAATVGSARWWKRGFVLGLVFSIPSAFGAVAMGLRWAPYGVAAITEGLVVGLLIAFIADVLLPPRSTRLSNAPRSAAWQRLAEEKACLEHLDAERAYRRDSAFGKTTEDRVVWGELLDLELQDIDEQVQRIRQGAGGASGPPSRICNDNPGRLRNDRHRPRGPK